MQNSQISTSPIDDGDIELFEAFLDNELTAEQSEQLRKRLANEPALAAELEHLRSERKLRAAMFSSLEGGEEGVVERALGQIHNGDQRNHHRAQQVRRLGQVMAVQKFQSLEKAREFSNDLQQWQIRQERLLNGQVTVQSAKY